MKKFLSVLLILLVAFGVICDSIWLIKYALGYEELAISTINVSTLSEATTPEEEYFININYYTNKNDNGFETFEIKFNSYTSIERNNIVGYGVQYIEPKFEVYNKKEMDFWITSTHNYVESISTSTVYYNTSNGTSYGATNRLNDKSLFIIDLGMEDVYYARFKGDQVVQYRQFFFNDRPSNYYKFDDASFSKLMYEALQGYSKGYGDFEGTTIFDITGYLEFGQLDNSNKFIKIEPTDSQLEEFKEFMTCKIHIDKNGMRMSEDSMFNLFNNEVGFNMAEVSDLTTSYFTDKQYYILNNEHFNYVVSDESTVIEIKYDAVIKPEVVTYLKQINVNSVMVYLSPEWFSENEIIYSGIYEIDSFNLVRYLLQDSNIAEF